MTWVMVILKDTMNDIKGKSLQWPNPTKCILWDQRGLLQLLGLQFHLPSLLAFRCLAGEDRVWESPTSSSGSVLIRGDQFFFDEEAELAPLLASSCLLCCREEWMNEWERNTQHKMLHRNIVEEVKDNDGRESTEKGTSRNFGRSISSKRFGEQSYFEKKWRDEGKDSDICRTIVSDMVFVRWMRR